jgi:Ulp1 family protease
MYWYIFINKNLNYIEEVPPVNDIDMDSTNQQVHQLLELNSDELCNMAQSLISYRFLPLEQHDTNLVENIFSGPANDDVIIYKFAILMTRAKLKCLHDEKWLNDEVINFYMLLLKDCSDAYYYKDPDIRLKSHYFSTYFMTRLLCRNKYDYNQVKRWSKKFDIFSLEKIFFPININNTHWILIVVRMLEKMISLYDSLNNVYPMYTDAVMKWIVDEGRVKKGVIVDKREWTIDSKPMPQAPRRK